jgi:drug/metabolite transporter (DMT)-like permease
VDAVSTADRRPAGPLGAGDTSRSLGLTAMVVSAAAYSLFTLFAQVALETLRPTDVLLWRFAIAAPVAWAVVGLRRLAGHGAGVFAVRWRPSIGLGLVFGVLAWLAFAALEHLTGSLYVVIIYTYPAMVAIAGRWSGRPSPVGTWGPLTLMLVGIVLTAPEVFATPGRGVWLGVAMTVANAALYAGYIVYSERVVGTPGRRPGGSTGESDGFVTAAWGMTGSLVTAIVFVTVAGGVRVPDAAPQIGAMLGLGVISTVVAGTGLLLGVRHLGPAAAALLATLEPVLALILLATLRGEAMSVVQATGAALVIGAVVWSQRLRAA